MLKKQMDKLIIGCGYLGCRVAKRWLAQGHTVHALTRGREPELKAVGIQPIRGDMRESLDATALPPADTVLYAVAPGRNEGQTPEDVWILGLIHITAVIEDWRTRPRLIFISSTSVYGQTDGEEVDESSPTQPRGRSRVKHLFAPRISSVRTGRTRSSFVLQLSTVPADCCVAKRSKPARRLSLIRKNG